MSSQQGNDHSRERGNGASQSEPHTVPEQPREDTAIERLVKSLRTGNQIEVGPYTCKADGRKSIFCTNIPRSIRKTKKRSSLP